MSEHDDVPTAPPARPSIVVVGGGEPTAHELAALTVALTPATPHQTAPAERAGWSAWQEAALLEGVGFRPFVSVDDVVRYHRSLA